MLHCIAFSSVTGKTFAWGANDSGELGVNSQLSTDLPQETLVPTNEKFVQVRCGGAFSLGIALQLSPVADTNESDELFTRSGNLVSPIRRKRDTLDSRSSDCLFTDTIITRGNESNN